MQQPKAKPKPALKKTTQNFGAYKALIKARPASGQSDSPVPSERPASGESSAPVRVRRTSGRHSYQHGQRTDRETSPDVPASRRTFRSTSSKGSRHRRHSGAGSDSDASHASRPASAATSVASSVGTSAAPQQTEDQLQSTAESILGLWDVNRAQEKTAEKEEVRERRHRASQEGFIEAAPEVPSVDALLRQRLSMSKWKGAVKAVGAVNKMGMLVKMRPPSAPTLIKQGHSMEAVAGSVLVRNLGTENPDANFDELLLRMLRLLHAVLWSIITTFLRFLTRPSPDCSGH